MATQGRAFYVLDDVPMLYQLNEKAPTETARLFQPKDTYRIGGEAAEGVAVARSARTRRAER